MLRTYLQQSDCLNVMSKIAMAYRLLQGAVEHSGARKLPRYCLYSLITCHIVSMILVPYVNPNVHGLFGLHSAAFLPRQLTYFEFAAAIHAHQDDLMTAYMRRSHDKIVARLSLLLLHMLSVYLQK